MSRMGRTPKAQTARVVEVGDLAAALSLHTAIVVTDDGRPELRAALMFGPRDPRRLCGRQLHLPDDAERLVS